MVGDVVVWGGDVSPLVKNGAYTSLTCVCICETKVTEC